MSDALAVGQEVRVFDVNGKRVGQPDGGWAGEIVKIGRALVTIVYGGSRRGTFRLDTGISNDAYQHQSFLTVEQAAAEGRVKAARAALREHGIEIRSGASLTLGQLEALVRVLGDSSKEA